MKMTFTNSKDTDGIRQRMHSKGLEVKQVKRLANSKLNVANYFIYAMEVVHVALYPMNVYMQVYKWQWGAKRNRSSRKEKTRRKIS